MAFEGFRKNTGPIDPPKAQTSFGNFPRTPSSETLPKLDNGQKYIYHDYDAQTAHSATVRGSHVQDLTTTLPFSDAQILTMRGRPHLHCAYHSGGAGHTTEDYINLKHRIQDMIDLKVVTLQTITPCVNSNLLPNHGGMTINMIEVEKDWGADKVIIPINPDGLEKAVSSLSIRYAYDNVPGKGIGNLFKESDVVIEKMIETPGIRDAKPKEQVPNWTATPLLIPRSS